MSNKLDFSIASSEQIAVALYERIENIRLMKNITQAQLAQNAGISIKTLGRMKTGENISLDSFIRLMMALGVQETFQILLPDVSVRPIERVRLGGKERKRARPKPKLSNDASPWTWNDELMSR